MAADRSCAGPAPRSTVPTPSAASSTSCRASAGGSRFSLTGEALVRHLALPRQRGQPAERTGRAGIDLNLTHTDGRATAPTTARAGMCVMTTASRTTCGSRPSSAFPRSTRRPARTPRRDKLPNDQPTSPSPARSARRGCPRFTAAVDDGLLSRIVLRDNAMELNGTFNCPQTRASTGPQRHYGFLAKWRRDFAAMRTRVISRVWTSIQSRRPGQPLVTRQARGANTVYTGYRAHAHLITG